VSDAAPATTVTDDAAAFAALLPAEGALLGLDLGTRTIGVATSDPRRSIATPLETLVKGKFGADATALAALAAPRGVCGVAETPTGQGKGRARPREGAPRCLASALYGARAC
jgi:putative Holliday junction resolvase